MPSAHRDSDLAVTMTSLVNGNAYYICGQAVDLAGNASAFSFMPAEVTIDTMPPQNPTSVSVPGASASSFNIVFTAGNRGQSWPI